MMEEPQLIITWPMIIERVLLPLVVIATPVFFTWIVKMLRKADKDRKSNAEASRALLYDKLKHLCEKHINGGYLCVEDRKNLQVLYEAYYDLDGNGFIECLYKQAMLLPIRKEEQ